MIDIECYVSSQWQDSGRRRQGLLVSADPVVVVGTLDVDSWFEGVLASSSTMGSEEVASSLLEDLGFL